MRDVRRSPAVSGRKRCRMHGARHRQQANPRRPVCPVLEVR